MEKEYISHIGGHITLFFTVEKEGRLLRNQGSRGVGLNIQHGVKVKLAIKQKNANINDTTISVTDLKKEPKDMLPILYGALLKNEQDVQLFEKLAFINRNQWMYKVFILIKIKYNP